MTLDKKNNKPKNYNTPEEHAIGILSRPIKCGYVNCGTVFGVGPLPYPYQPMKDLHEWEMMLHSHQVAAGHKRRKLAWADEEK